MTSRYSRYVLALSLLLVIIMLACGGIVAGAQQRHRLPLKVAFLCVGPITDNGYNAAHNSGRLYLQSHLPNVQTTIVDKVPESSDAERVMEKMIAQGNRLIFATSFGYLEPAERVAKRHPDVVIMQSWRPSSLSNIGSYSTYEYEPLYVVGMVAGKLTKTNKLGFVAGHPISQILQNINAFMLGVRSVNPKAKVHVVWTNSWSDPPTEAEAAKGLIDSGVDVLGCVLDSPLTVAKTAEQNHIMFVGSQADLQKIAPNSWLTGSRWNWDMAYYKFAKSVDDKSWKPQTHWLGMKDGVVELCSFGKLVPKPVQKEATAQAEQIKQGKQIIFKGPLRDREGRQRLAIGQIANSKWLSEMDWFVEGVDGTLPRH